MNAAEIELIAKAIARAVVAELTTLANPPAVVKPKTQQTVFIVGPFVIDIERA